MATIVEIGRFVERLPEDTSCVIVLRRGQKNFVIASEALVREIEEFHARTKLWEDAANGNSQLIFDAEDQRITDMLALPSWPRAVCMGMLDAGLQMPVIAPASTPPEEDPASGREEAE